MVIRARWCHIWHVLRQWEAIDRHLDHGAKTLELCLVQSACGLVRAFHVVEIIVVVLASFCLDKAREGGA